MNMIQPKKKYIAEVDADGRLIIPKPVAESFHLRPGTQIVLEEGPYDVSFHRSVNQLNRIYVEPTNTCNLNCLTCVRNVWDETPGTMSRETFNRILTGLRDFSPLPTIFIGGYGEPLGHPWLIEMIRELKTLGACVEMITNGVLLNEAIISQLIQVGLDMIWVSVDGARPESYTDIRLGAALPEVIQNIVRLRDMRDHAEKEIPQIGVSFVAMKRNIADLPELLGMYVIQGVDHFSISNLLAHTPELRGEILYQHAMDNDSYQSVSKLPLVSLPRMDVSPEMTAVYGEAFRRGYRLNLAGHDVGQMLNVCPFVQKGSTAIRWDGAVSPCLPLMHTHDSYLDDRVRRSHAYIVGNINERNLMDLWNDADYASLRERLSEFDFSPCSYCNSCEKADSNLEDCSGSDLPACGGCLWAQRLILCP